MTWTIVFEGRPAGAIGKFSHYWHTSNAPTQDAALSEAQQILNKKGIETRFPVSATQHINEETQP